MLELPGIVYRDGPSGRRAGLARGPDVWEVIREVRRVAGAGEQRIVAAAVNLGLPEGDVRLAVDCCTADPEPIDARIAANARALQEARRMAEARDHLAGVTAFLVDEMFPPAVAAGLRAPATTRCTSPRPRSMAGRTKRCWHVRSPRPASS